MPFAKGSFGDGVARCRLWWTLAAATRPALDAAGKRRTDNLDNILPVDVVVAEKECLQITSLTTRVPTFSVPDFLQQPYRIVAIVLDGEHQIQIHQVMQSVHGH